MVVVVWLGGVASNCWGHPESEAVLPLLATLESGSATKYPLPDFVVLATVTSDKLPAKARN